MHLVYKLTPTMSSSPRSLAVVKKSTKPLWWLKITSHKTPRDKQQVTTRPANNQTIILEHYTDEASHHRIRSPPGPIRTHLEALQVLPGHTWKPSRSYQDTAGSPPGPEERGIYRCAPPPKKTKRPRVSHDTNTLPVNSRVFVSNDPLHLVTVRVVDC